MSSIIFSALFDASLTIASRALRKASKSSFFIEHSGAAVVSTTGVTVVSTLDSVALEESLEEILENAKNFRLNHKPISAISEYQKALQRTEDNSVKAQCYENIAIIYASAKRYGSALSYAQRAYNISPTVSREVLLARLYYKTGSTEKAVNRMDNLLKKDFTLE